MAVPVVQVIESGDKNHVIHVIGEADVAGATIVDVSAIQPSTRFGQPTSVRLDRIQYDTDATFKLDWAATAAKTFFVAPPGQDTKSYKDIGGINNDAGAGVTGDVLIPAPAAAADYTATLWFTKKFN